MSVIIQKFWWTLMLRGVIAMVFGVSAFFCGSLSSLGYLFGIFALFQGALSFLPAFTTGSKEILLAGIEGGMGVLVAFFILLGSSTGALLWPSVSNVMFLIYIISWIVVTGAVSLAMFIRLRGEGSGTLYMGLNAALCLIFGVLMVFRHEGGVLGNMEIIGLFGILYGVVLVLIGRKAKAQGGKSLSHNI